MQVLNSRWFPSSTVQEDGRHPHSFRAAYIIVVTISDVDRSAGRGTCRAERCAKDFRAWLLRSDFARDGDGIEVARQPHRIKQWAQAFVPIGNDADVQAPRPSFTQRVVHIRKHPPHIGTAEHAEQFLEARRVLLPKRAENELPPPLLAGDRQTGRLTPSMTGETRAPSPRQSWESA